MTAGLESNVTVKIFVGCQVNSELRMHLTHSELWKQEQIGASRSDGDISELRYQEKDYVGFLLAEEQLSLSEVRELESRLLTQLAELCPGLNTDPLKVLVIPQLFLA